MDMVCVCVCVRAGMESNGKSHQISHRKSYPTVVVEEKPPRDVYSNVKVCY